MKFICILFILCSFISYEGWSQENNNLQSAWHWGISASADYIRFQPSGVLHYGTGWGVPITQEYHDGKIGWSIRPYLSYRLSRHWEGQVGLGYTAKKVYAKAYGPGPVDLPITTEGTTTFEYISLPVSLRYYLFQKKNAYFISTGFSMDANIDSSYGRKKVAFSHAVGLGSLMNIYNDLFFRVEPILQYAISNYDKIPHNHGVFRFRPYSFGIILGMRKSI